MTFINSAALVAVTAILVVFLPRYFETQPQVIAHGYVAPGFENVLEVFRENFETGRDSRYGGSAFSAYYKGEKVVDVWGGYADGEIRQPWREDTMSVFYSTTKGVAAICLAMLADRGLLDYDKPVAHYWPEFAQKGKGRVTVRELIEHKAGLMLAGPPGLSAELLRDVPKAGELMAFTEPILELDGKTHGYHPVTFGPLTNELLRRVDPKHRTMGKFFAEEIGEPFGIDFHIGLPLEQNYRVARTPVQSNNIFLLLAQGFSSRITRQAMWYFMRHDLFSRALANSGLQQPGFFNDPYNRAIEIPSAGGIGTARSVAKLFSIVAMGGTDPETNKTLLSKKAADDLMKSEEPTFDICLGVPMAFNLGFFASDVVEGEMMYGHPGAGGQMGYADPTHQVGFGFVSSTISPFFLKDDPRTDAILAAFYKSVRIQEQK
ncbi:beta-lactamase domain-containing protein 2-like [Diadema setosum]|uniref:beta-lactamase domain-containing protein 2-like n=1 Tax=Diadema setosum TaxID=31175 RepID=UPI003B3B59A1